MGLLADSKQSRRRISKDPNNTKWSRDTTTFGQRILRAQGWEPGQYLGARNAAHANLHTAANASYIRVSVKDDAKGIGYDRAQEDRITGLDVVSDLLNRLNGKPETEIEADRAVRFATQTHQYVERKWGSMRFLRGGLLVGDEIQQLEDDSPSVSIEQPPTEANQNKVKSRRNSAKGSERASDTPPAAAPTPEAGTRREEKRRKKDKGQKKKKKKGKGKEDEETQELEAKSTSSDGDLDAVQSGDAAAESPHRKQKTKGKRKRRSDDEDVKKDVKSKKRKKTEERPDGNEGEGKTAKRKAKKERREKEKKKKQQGNDEAKEETEAAASSSTASPGLSTQTASSGRLFARSRFIAAKRQALMDTKALNQIFMMKS